MILHGDCLELLKTLPDNSVDSVVTDPPYGLSDHRPEHLADCLRAWLAGEPYRPKKAGFMGKAWDAWVPGPEIWRECLRVLKPGGHLLAFAGTRSQDLMGLSLRLAGFEIRDMIAWVYGSGFPKSLNVSKAVERQDVDVTDAERQFCEWLRDESGLSVADVGTDRYHEQRIEIVNTATKEAPRWGRRALVPTFAAWQKLKGLMTFDPPEWVERLVKNPPMPPVTHPGQWKRGKGEGTTGENNWAGWGTSLKPSFEPLTVARKPLIGTVAENVLKYGTGALNIDAARVNPGDKIPGGGTRTVKRTFGKGGDTGDKGMFDPDRCHKQPPHDYGRWPANLTHDGSDQVLALFPETKSGAKLPHHQSHESPNRAMSGKNYARGPQFSPASQGSAARFFYCSKASKRDRDEGLDGFKPGQYSHDGRKTPIENPYQRNQSIASNTHTTVKPTKLMRWLVKLVTPPGGTVLDPFMGSGSTGKACALEGFNFIGIEREAEYVEIAKARIAYAERQPKQLGLEDAA